MSETPRHLIHVGFPKCGSTALQQWFAAHPALLFEHDALGGHSSATALARFVARGRQLAAWHVTSSEHLVMPRVSDIGMDTPADIPIAKRRQWACALLHDLFGEATVLIVSRGHKEVLASSYSQYLRTGGTLSRREFFGYLKDQSGTTGFEAHFDYDATVALYERVFGPENVVVMPYELMLEDPEMFVARLEDRLGIERSGSALPWANPSLSGPELIWYPRLSRAVAWATTPFGARGARGLELYRGRIGGQKLRLVASMLAWLSGESEVDLRTHVPDEVLQRCQARAASLAARPDYARYRAQYLS